MSLALPIKNQPTADRTVVRIVFLLAVVGIAAVYSALAFLAETKAGGNLDRLLLRHVVFVGGGLAAMLVLSRIDYKWTERFAKYGLIGSIVLLVGVLIAGVAAKGATRWIRFGTVGFQPSDFARFFLICYVSVLVARKQTYIQDFKRGFLPILAWIGVTVALIGSQNLSTALLLLATTLTICFVGRVSLAQLGLLALGGVVLGGTMLALSPARAARVENHLGVRIFSHTDSTQVFDDAAEGYQGRQAEIAFAMGGVGGVGPGKGIQRDFLPEAYNDFIYAIIGEEYGSIAAVVILTLFLLLLYRGFRRIAFAARDPLGYFLAIGLTTTLVLYGFVHAGVNLGLFPVTGLPMPFVSFGGSSLVTSGAMVGVLLNVSRHRAQASA